MKVKNLLYLLVAFSIVAFGCTQTLGLMEMGKLDKEDSEFKKMCQDAGYEWMFMKPTQDGKFIKDAEECWGCMVEGIEHVCDKNKFMEFITIR